MKPNDSLEARDYLLRHNSFLLHTKAGALNLFDTLSDLTAAGYSPSVKALKVVIPYDMTNDEDHDHYGYRPAWVYDNESTTKRIYAHPDDLETLYDDGDN